MAIDKRGMVGNWKGYILEKKEYIDNLKNCGCAWLIEDILLVI